MKDGVVTDDTRVRAAIPTIKYLKEQGAGIILMSHLGRPKGDGPEPELSLRPAAEKLAELTGYDVRFVDDTYGEKAEKAVSEVKPGDILVLENVRFLKAEKKNDPEVAKKLASYGDVFVLDAFGTAHRAQGSVVGPAAYIPAVAGFLLDLLAQKYGMEEEDFLSSELEVVPAGAARDLGFDRSMILGYGHDDRSCSFPSLVAQLEAEDLERTGVCLLVDKEEIGSVGATGMTSLFFENTMAEILALAGEPGDLALRRCLARSSMLSSDVSAGFDPTYASAFEEKNAAFLGRGVVFNKFTGSRGTIIWTMLRLMRWPG